VVLYIGLRAPNSPTASPASIITKQSTYVKFSIWAIFLKKIRRFSSLIPMLCKWKTVHAWRVGEVVPCFGPTTDPHINLGLHMSFDCWKSPNVAITLQRLGIFKYWSWEQRDMASYNHSDKTNWPKPDSNTPIEIENNSVSASLPSTSSLPSLRHDKSQYHGPKPNALLLGSNKTCRSPHTTPQISGF
jgi:hypothetical protein